MGLKPGILLPRSATTNVLGSGLLFKVCSDTDLRGLSLKILRQWQGGWPEAGLLVNDGHGQTGHPCAFSMHRFNMHGSKLL